MSWPWANYLTFLNPRTRICKDGNHPFFVMEFHQSSGGGTHMAQSLAPGSAQETQAASFADRKPCYSPPLQISIRGMIPLPPFIQHSEK